MSHSSEGEVMLRPGPGYLCSISGSVCFPPFNINRLFCRCHLLPGAPHLAARRLFKMLQQLLIKETPETWTRIHLSVRARVALAQPGWWSYPAVGANRQLPAEEEPGLNLRWALIQAWNRFRDDPEKS